LYGGKTLIITVDPSLKQTLEMYQSSMYDVYGTDSFIVE